MVKQFVTSIGHIRSNIKKFSQYENGTDEEREFYESLIAKGMAFVAYEFNGGLKFAPSRFVGYQSNDRIKHSEWREHGLVDGRDTTPKIEALLGRRIKSDEPTYLEIDSAFRNFCQNLGIEPDNRKRSYWILQDEVNVSMLEIDQQAMEAAFKEFKALIAEYSDHDFTNFNEGLTAGWENYKPLLREYALSILKPDEWQKVSIGDGVILEATIAAIEIQESGKGHINNLVFWQNRFGHASRVHKIFLEARTDKILCGQIEQALFDLFHNSDDGKAFEALNEISGGKYPLIAYLFFLKDSSRYMPIVPTTFDKVFIKLNIDLITLRNCSWDNYQAYNGVLENVAAFLKQNVKQDSLGLIDAHSFCWVYIRVADKLEKQKQGSAIGNSDGVVLGERANRIYDMVESVLSTVASSQGQEVKRTVKVKKLKMSKRELEREIKRLLEIQNNMCALTGLPLDYANHPKDKQVKPSLDRIDSDGDYEKGNLQVVCRFINFWKSDQDNEEFIRLLSLVRGEAEPLHGATLNEGY
jgi:hypothetical protein